MSNTPEFKNAYRTALKNHLAPLILLPKDNEIFPLPFTDALISATIPLTIEAVNSLIYKLANTTLANDGFEGNYADDLNTYLNTVHKSSLRKGQLEQPGGTKKPLQPSDAEANLLLAQVEADAKKFYDFLPSPKPPFNQWVLLNYPPYAAAQRAVILNEGGTMGETTSSILDEYKDKMKKALDTTTSHPSLNMAVKDENNAKFRPHYSALGLRNQLNTWIQGKGQEQTLFEVKNGSGTLKFTTKGSGKFDLRPGQWDVPGVKTLYPKRETGAPDVLDPKYALPLSVLVAYSPKLEVERRGDGGWQNDTTASAPDNKPYIAVLGILGQHFPVD